MRIQPSRISWWLFLFERNREIFKKLLTMVISSRIILIVLGKKVIL